MARSPLSVAASPICSTLIEINVPTRSNGRHVLPFGQRRIVVETPYYFHPRSQRPPILVSNAFACTAQKGSEDRLAKYNDTLLLLYDQPVSTSNGSQKLPILIPTAVVEIPLLVSGYPARGLSMFP
jgi:hypothetical protein